MLPEIVYCRLRTIGEYSWHLFVIEPGQPRPRSTRERFSNRLIANNNAVSAALPPGYRSGLDRFI